MVRGEGSTSSGNAARLGAAQKRVTATSPGKWRQKTSDLSLCRQTLGPKRDYRGAYNPSFYVDFVAQV